MKYIRVFVLSVLAFLLITDDGCSKPNSAAPAGQISIAGQWYVELNTTDVGYVRIMMTFEQDGSSFEAYSREGAASDIVGWFKLLMAKIFTHYFSHGALLHFINGKIDGHVSDGGNMHNANITATFASALGDMRFAGTLDDSTFTGTIYNGDQPVGKVWASRGVRAFPLDDYPALVERVQKATEEKIFDVKQMQSAEWLNFIAKLKDGATRSQDDADMIFKFFQLSRTLPFSHYYLTRETSDTKRFFSPEQKQTGKQGEENTNPDIRLSGVDSGCAVLRIRSFAGELEPIDSCFWIIASAHDSALIIDLRGNPGGNVSALRVAAHLADKPYPGGAFVTRKWFDAHNSAPTPAQMNVFPELTEANVGILLNGIHDSDGLSMRVMPDSVRYKGKVFVLVDGNTASACEPLVYALKQNKLAIIVGENTAGQMLNGEKFDVGGGWKLFLPTADYYTADGVRLDRRGVAPDYTVKSADAMNTVKGWISSGKLPEGKE